MKLKLFTRATPLAASIAALPEAAAFDAALAEHRAAHEQTRELQRQADQLQMRIDERTFPIHNPAAAQERLAEIRLAQAAAQAEADAKHTTLMTARAALEPAFLEAATPHRRMAVQRIAAAVEEIRGALETLDAIDAAALARRIDYRGNRSGIGVLLPWLRQILKHAPAVMADEGRKAAA